MAKPQCIELPGSIRIPILYEDRTILAIDKPAGWMLVPVSWQKTDRNLQAALLSSLASGHYWARSRNLKFLKYVHRLDGETSGILLLAKSPGALNTVGGLFESRQMEKIYLAVTAHEPKQPAWTCRLSLAPDPASIGRMRADATGKKAETAFRCLASTGRLHLIEARPYTGRTHQIRVHLAEAGCPVIGDELYGRDDASLLGLRAVGLAYRDPFTRKRVSITAPTQEFLRRYGFPEDAWQFSHRDRERSAAKPGEAPTQRQDEAAHTSCRPASTPKVKHGK